MIRFFAFPTTAMLAVTMALSACGSKSSSNGNDASASPKGGASGNVGGSTGGASQGGATGGQNTSTLGNSGGVAGSAGTAMGGKPAESGGSASGGAGGETTGASSGGTTGSSTGGTTGSSTGGTTSGSTGGTTTGGVGGATGGSTGGGQPVAPCTLPQKLWTGSASRPQLTDAAAECFTIPHYFAAAGPVGSLKDDPWDPTGGLNVSAFPAPKLTVASDGSGSHKSVQEAIDAATGSERVYILVKPGIYKETVCVKGETPITLYGAESDASKVTIAYGNYNGKSVSGSKTNPCQVPSAANFGTTDSSTFFVKANHFQAVNMTIENDFTGTGQAVAMTTHGDKIIFQNVAFYGYQDTFQPGTSANGTVVRSYYKSCFIQGDTDFIMGAGVAVLDNCDINYIGKRKSSGCHLAPSTDGRQTYGILIINSRIKAGEGTKSGSTKLGRAWNNSGNPNANGQVVIRDTEIDGHVNASEPWDTSTGGSKIPFDANKNRMFEYKNKGTGAAK